MKFRLSGGMGVLFWVAVAGASPQSEILVAKGEVALHQGRLNDARTHCQAAIDADASDATAHLAMGRVLMRLDEPQRAVAAFERALALDPTLDAARTEIARAHGGTDSVSTQQAITVGEIGRLPSVRGRDAAKRWSLNFTFGVQYDSNVTLEPRGRVGLGLGDADDVAFVLAGGGDYTLVERPNMLVRLEYDLYQTLHPDLDDFDFRANQPRVTASWGPKSWFWVGVQGGYNHYTLGPHSYLGEPYAMPFVSFVERDWGLTQVQYRWGDDTYFATPFNDLRDGPNQAISISQALYLPAERYLTFGYQYGAETPQRSRGDAFALRSNSLWGGGGFGAPLGTYVDLLYIFRYDDYTHSVSGAGQATSRRDDGHFLYVGLSRPLTDHLAVAVTYYGAFNASNVSFFDYQRNVVATLLQVTY